MSNVADVLDPQPQPPAPSQAGMVSWLGRNAWALADQVLISGTNFVTMVLTARSLGIDAFGDFALIYSAMLLLNILPSTLITQAHNVIGATLSGEKYRRYTTTAGLGQLLLSGILAGVALVAYFIAAANGARFAALLMVIPAAIIGWQLQEFVRRVLYSEGRTGAALVNDIFSYGGQTALVAVLWWSGRLTGPIAMWVLAGTSSAATLLGLWQLRRSLGWRLDRDTFRENWNFGKWLVGAEILGWFASLHMYMVLAAFILGTAATGELKAAQILFGPARIMVFFMSTVLPIRFSRTFAAGGDGALLKRMKDIYKVIVPLMGIYCLMMALGAKPLLMLFGREYAGGHTVLVLYACCAFLNYMEMVVSAGLLAKRLTRYIFAGYVYSATIALTMSWMFIKVFGANGAIMCMIVSSLVVFLSLLRAYVKNLNGRGFEVVLKPVEAA